ncbi:MAG: hypothetical protein WAN35_00320 [Terracidiphilus sp.]
MLHNLIASALIPTSPFEILQRVVWTLTFAALLVLLVVILGRGRAHRFPCFTAIIALTALRLMVEVLLGGRVGKIPFSFTVLSMADLAVLVNLLVLVELARRAFTGLHRPLWIVNSAGLALVASGVVVVWGPWPVWKDLAVGTLLGKLYLMQLMMQKGEMLVALLTVGLGVLVLLFGRQFKVGWRSHTLMIVLGLAMVSAVSLAFQGGLQIAVLSRHIHSQADFDKIRVVLSSAQQVVFLAALLWWISWLWLDEPDAAASPSIQEPPQAA